MNRKSTIESLVLGCLIITVGGYLAVSSGFISLQVPSGGTSGSQYKQQQTSQQQEQQNNIQIESCKPQTTIANETEYFKFCDSKGNPYGWNMPLSAYDYNVQRDKPISYLSLHNTFDGSTIQVVDYTKFVEPDFTKVIDDVYNNAGSDDQFLFETWYIVSQMTTYNKDITNSNLWPLEVLARSGGDCKDLSILIASMIRSSEHTKDWKVQLVYLDADNPTKPQTSNHMIVEVDTGKAHYTIEATAKSNGLHFWDGTNISGWKFNV